MACSLLDMKGKGWKRDELLVLVWGFVDGEMVDFEGGKFPS